MIIQSGTTSDGKTVVRGVYHLYETEGLPLDVIFDALQEHGAIPDWIAFLVEAETAGMKRSRVLSMLDAAIADSYGSKMRDVVIQRLSR